MKFSLLTLWISIIFITTISLFYYPKWNKAHNEATISWDVSGYYWYLPAIFIYKDLRKLGFNQAVLNKYKPTPELQQAFKAPNDNYVMKYSCGQAIMMFPAFYAGHLWAKTMGYEADGFSKPYQFAIFFWGILISIFGLILLRKVMLHFFSEHATGIILLIIALGTNYLEYGAITNAMTHNYLFTLYTMLLWFTIYFYKRPGYLQAVGLGLCLGLMALTRPTEIIASIIPVLWGVSIHISSITARVKLFVTQYKQIILSVFCVLIVGSIQLFYWKFTANSWVVYSYTDQGFSWLRPHFFDGMLSGRAGCLVYTPVMVLSLIGFLPLFKRHAALAPSLFIFSLIFIYVTFAWDIWWYGGSVGQRSLVQIYPVLAFPLAALIDHFKKVNVKSIIVSFFIIISVHYSIWVIHNAHYGGLLVAGEMTSDYLKSIFLRNKMPDQALKLLDTRKIYSGDIIDPQTLMSHTDTINYIGDMCLSDSIQFSPAKKFKLPSSEGWLRASADFYTENKEWDTWKMTQLIIRYYKNGKELRSDVLRVQRHLSNGQKINLWLDSKLRYNPDEAEILLWNSDGKNKICVENIKLLYHKG
ncbi:MAG: hypothetical protein IPO92_14240 [Saprospiraceae bacterium]|nr:hypothetical protein [Saprospiraceae bacterium]